MSNISEYNYGNIDQPYNDSLERSEVGVVGAGAGFTDGSTATIAGSDDSVGSGGQVENAGELAEGVVDSGKIVDLWIKNWIKSNNYAPKVRGFLIDGLAGYIECMKLYVGDGGIVGGKLDIPDTTTTNSFHVDTTGNVWWGANVADGYTSANAYVLNTGEAVFKNVTLTDSVTIGDIQSGSEISIQNWQSNLVFSATDYNTIAWSSGIITLMDGTTYSIDAGNTGNVSALTYIYLDIATSITVLQTTTTPATAVGTGKILVAVMEDNDDATSDATFQVFGGSGGAIWTTENIATNTITANEILTNTITAAEIDSGTITTTELNFSPYVIGSNDLDDVTDGTTYGKVLNTQITAGEIVLSAVSGDLDDITDGTSYGKVLNTQITAGEIVLSAVSGDLDDVADGTSYGKVLNTQITAGEIVLSAVSGDLDDIDDGTTYGKVAGTNISAGNIVLQTNQNLGSQGIKISTATTGARVELLPDANTGIQIVDDSSNDVFKALIGGTDVGDVIIGDYAGGQGLKYDKSAGTMYYKNLAWSEVVDDDGNAPDDNATAGATFGTNISGGGDSNDQVSNDGYVTRYLRHIFGDASTASGTTTISSNTNLTADSYYENLTISSGASLDTNGYRLFVSDTLTINSGCSVQYAGADGGNGTNAADTIGTTAGAVGVGGAAGAAQADGVLTGGLAGKAGTNGAGGGVENGASSSAGAAGEAIVKGFVGSGVAGAQGGSGGDSNIGYSGGAGGAAGAAGATSTAVYNTPHNVVFAIRMYDDNGTDDIRAGGGAGGSSGGGAGAGDTVYPNPDGGSGGGAGGSGSCGGVMVVAARIIVNNGEISCDGGNGGNGGAGGDGGDGTNPSYGRAGGGGGGGAGGSGGSGGICILIYNSYSGSGTKSANGGTAGTGGAKGDKGIGYNSPSEDGDDGVAGANGNAGTAGKLIEFEI